MLRWLFIGTWKYLFIGICKYLFIDMWKYLFSKNNGSIGVIRTAICRYKGHPSGVWYYNVNGLEPDMHCKHCNDNLG